jgi:hypothetical protein
MSMPEQLPQIAILRIGYPDARKAIFQQELQNQLRILSICLLLSYLPGPDLGCVSDPQLKLRLLQQALEPASMPTRFHPYPHRNCLRRKLTIKSFGFIAML